MVDLEYTIKSENGIHARPAGRLAQLAKDCQDVIITISHSGKKCEVKNMLSVMKLGLRKNDAVTFHLDGPSESRENEIKEQLNNLLDSFGNLDDLNSSLADS